MVDISLIAVDFDLGLLCIFSEPPNSLEISSAASVQMVLADWFLVQIVDFRIIPRSLNVFLSSAGVLED